MTEGGTEEKRLCLERVNPTGTVTPVSGWAWQLRFLREEVRETHPPQKQRQENLPEILAAKGTSRNFHEPRGQGFPARLICVKGAGLKCYHDYYRLQTWQTQPES